MRTAKDIIYEMRHATLTDDRCEKLSAEIQDYLLYSDESENEKLKLLEYKGLLDRIRKVG